MLKTLNFIKVNCLTSNLMETLLANFKYIISNEFDDVFLLTNKDDINQIRDYIKNYKIEDFIMNKLVNYYIHYYSQIKIKQNTFLITVLQIWKKDKVAYLPNISLYECDIKNKTTRCKNIHDNYETFDDFIERIIMKEDIFLSKQIKSDINKSIMNKTNNTFTKLSDAYYFEVKLFF